MAATLDVRAVSEMSAARADVSSLGDAVRSLGSDVDAAGGQARSASVNFDALGEGSDNVASKSSQAAAGIGDLAGGLEAVGATGAASALEGVALASSVAAGAGDVLNLVAETSVGRWVANTAATVAHRTASIAGTVATGAMTAAQTALNVVMAASPVLILVAGIALLVGGIILAYKHSETFRNIVDGAFSRARDVVEGAVGAVQDFIGWTKDLPGEARAAWEAVKQVIGDKVDDAAGFVTDLYDDVAGGVEDIKDDVAGAFGTMFAPILTAVGWVQDLINKIESIDFPSIDIPGLPRLALGGAEGPGLGLGDKDPRITVPITVNGAIDPDGTARTIIDVLRRANLRGLQFDAIGIELTLP